MAIEDRRPFDLTLISRRFPPQIGGAEKVMRNFAFALADLGNRVTVLCSSDPADRIAPTARPVSANAAVNPSVVRLKYSGVRVVGTAFYMRALRKWLDRHPPSLIYVSMLKHDAYVATRWGASAGVPVVLRPEGAGATGDMAWQACNRFGPRIRSETLKADAYVALSDRIRGDLIDSGYDPNRIYVIPNGVPIPADAWAGQRSNEPVAVFVGRLAFEKGIDRLLKAWPIVIAECTGARLLLVGEGPEAVALRQLAERLGIAGSVEFAGPRTDIDGILRHSAVFVLPSREEGLSIALLEAMALGMPAVVSDIPGNRAIVDPEKTGQILDAADPNALAAALTRAFRRDSAILAMTRAGRELVANRYSVEAAAIRHEDLFHELIVRKRASRA